VKYYLALGQQQANVSTDVYTMSVQAFNMLQLAIEGKIMDAFLNTDERLHPAFLHIERLRNDDDDNNIKNNVTPLTKESNDSLIEILKIEQEQSVTLLDALRNNYNITNELQIKDNKIKELETLLILEREANSNLRKRKNNTTTNNIEDISDGSDENCDTNNILTKKLKTEKNI